MSQLWLCLTACMLAAACDEGATSGPCAAGTPSCAAFTTFDPERCECVRIADTGPLSCEAADVLFHSRLGDDRQIRELQACQQDADCAAWQPIMRCEANGLTVLNCARGMNAGRIEAADQRVSALSSDICTRVDPECRIGVSCLPSPQPRCQDSLCAVEFGTGR